MSLEKRRWKTGLDAGVKGPLESRCSDGQSQRGVQGLRNEQGGGRVEKIFVCMCVMKTSEAYSYN